MPYDLVEVDILAEDDPPAEHYARQPFGKIPAFEHAGFSQQAALKIGVITGSIASGVCGWLVLHLSLPKAT